MEIMKGKLRDVEDGMKRFKTNGSELYQGQGGEYGRNIFQREKDWEFSRLTRDESSNLETQAGKKNTYLDNYIEISEYQR